mgnify:FL=1
MTERPKRVVVPLSDAQQQLAAAWIRLVRKLVGEAAQSRTEYDDLLGPATEALLRAARAFRPGTGWTFQALLTRCVKNAIIDVRRRRRNEVEFKDWHLDGALEPAPPRPERPPHPEPATPPCGPQELARAAAVAALHAGQTYRAARAAASAHIGRPPSLDTVHGWARAAGVAPRRRGRPSKVHPTDVARWLQAGSMTAAQESTGVHRVTLWRCCKMFGGVSRLRRTFPRARSEHRTAAHHSPAPARRSLPAWD